MRLVKKESSASVTASVSCPVRRRKGGQSGVEFDERLPVYAAQVAMECRELGRSERVLWVGTAAARKQRLMLLQKLGKGWQTEVEVPPRGPPPDGQADGDVAVEPLRVGTRVAGSARRVKLEQRSPTGRHYGCWARVALPG